MSNLFSLNLPHSRAAKSLNTQESTSLLTGLEHLHHGANFFIEEIAAQTKPIEDIHAKPDFEHFMHLSAKIAVRVQALVWTNDVRQTLASAYFNHTYLMARLTLLAPKFARDRSLDKAFHGNLPNIHKHMPDASGAFLQWFTEDAVKLAAVPRLKKSACRQVEEITNLLLEGIPERIAVGKTRIASEAYVIRN